VKFLNSSVFPVSWEKKNILRYQLEDMPVFRVFVPEAF